MSVIIVVQIDGTDCEDEYQTNLSIDEWNALDDVEKEDWKKEALEDITSVLVMDDETNEGVE